MVKLPKFNLDNIKKMGEDLVGSVTSGDALGKIKSTVGARVSREVLPEELQQRVTLIEGKIEDVTILQKSLNDAISGLKKEALELCKDAVAMYQPKE